MRRRRRQSQRCKENYGLEVGLWKLKKTMVSEGASNRVMIRTKEVPLNLETKNLGDLGENNSNGELGVALKGE